MHHISHISLCAPKPNTTVNPPQSPRTALNLMTAAEIDAIINEAESCAHGECAVDEVESLISNLQDQQSLLSKRIEEIDGLVKDLEHVNGKDDRPVDEVRETVRAIFRVFALGVSFASIWELYLDVLRHGQ